MLVMSLEEYDEISGRAEKSPILRKDVVGQHKPVTSVQSAEEGLLVSLNRQGCVNLELISELYGRPTEQVIAELGDLIYRNPASASWETADEYLSGNVREKLVTARNAGLNFKRKVAALEAVQPEDILPGDIDAGLGSPWIPADDIQEFAAHLFGVDRSSVRISRLEKDAVWDFTPDYTAESSVAATSDFGTSRANGTWLLQLALNMKSPTIYDTVQREGREERVINQQETLAAREKQKRIKERFRSWIFSDPERTERLIRIYNDTYNNLRPRLYDGSHLEFPGMNEDLSLRPHQKDAVWRCMSSGNTLLAHVVGAGKTYTMAATGMKMKQAGLIHKPMYVVPNHLLEQFAREFMQLYPNARLLVAAKEDFTKNRRKLLTARIASGDWDGIIVTHSSFERIGMSKPYQQKFLEQQIAEYDQLLQEHASERGSGRNVIKLIEKQKAAREEKLQHLLSEDRKDDGLVFDELGVDHVFIDEAHSFKNLETPTKMDRVAGVQTGGSKRAFDVYMKARWLGEQHPGHGVTFATGTPVSNTMVELYTMQRFLDPEGLISRGIEHFDAWAATFGEVVDSMEISPDGAGLRPRSRFARFTNLPELQQMFRAFADVRTAEMLNLPRPELRGGKPMVVVSPMSPEQQEFQQQLVKRYERVRSEKIDPREDNALAITTDGRKLATDARMLQPEAADFAESKVNRLVENVYATSEQSADQLGTQLIFADMGVNPTAWGYSPYDEIVQKLVERGVPPEQIATVGTADTDAKKQALFEKVRNGSVRVLLGSTQKMGTGTNVQKRLVALHHLDAPWKPAEVEQREGRILRQGNLNPEVSIYRYVTEGSFDAYMWQALETKARFIGQVITDENAARQAEDIGSQELSYAEVKAIASGNPAVLTLSEADAELQRMAILRKNHLDEQFVARRKVHDLPATLRNLRQRLENLQADHETCKQHTGPAVQIGERPISQDDLAAVLGGRLETLKARVPNHQRVLLGKYHGLSFGMLLHPEALPEVYLEGAVCRMTRVSSATPGPRAIMNALERLTDSCSVEIAHVERDITIGESQLRDYQSRIGSCFAHEDYVRELTELRDALRRRLTGSGATEGAPDEPNTGELASRIKSLMAGNTAESSPALPQRRVISAEEPVTTRIRRRQSEQADDGVSEQAGVEVPTLPEEPSAANDPEDRTFTGRIRERRHSADAELSLT
jgi:N12 class adenine-specific DNA methylase